MLLYNSPYPDVARRLEVSAAYPLADQVLRRLNTGFHVDESKAVAKSAVKENRNRRDCYVPRARHEIGANIEFTNIVLKISRHTPMALARPMGGQHDKLDAIDVNGTVLQRADDLIITASERQLDFVCHLGSPSLLREPTTWWNFSL